MDFKFSYLVHVLLSVIFTGFISHTVVHHAVSLLVSAAFTDGTVRSSLLQQSNFKPWLQQLVLLAKEVDTYFPICHSCRLPCLASISCTRKEDHCSSGCILSVVCSLVICSLLCVTALLFLWNILTYEDINP